MRGEDGDEVEVGALLITVVEGVEGAGEAADPRGLPVDPAPGVAPTLLSTSARNKNSFFTIGKDVKATIVLQFLIFWHLTFIKGFI